MSWRPFQEVSRHLPELIAVVTQNHRVSHPRKNNDLPIAIRKLGEEADQILFRSDAIILATHEQYRRLNFPGSTTGKLAVISR